MLRAGIGGGVGGGRGEVVLMWKNTSGALSLWRRIFSWPRVAELVGERGMSIFAGLPVRVCRGGARELHAEDTVRGGRHDIACPQVSRRGKKAGRRVKLALLVGGGDFCLVAGMPCFGRSGEIPWPWSWCDFKMRLQSALDLSTGRQLAAFSGARSLSLLYVVGRCQT